MSIVGGPHILHTQFPLAPALVRLVQIWKICFHQYGPADCQKLKRKLGNTLECFLWKFIMVWYEFIFSLFTAHLGKIEIGFFVNLTQRRSCRKNNRFPYGNKEISYFWSTEISRQKNIPWKVIRQVLCFDSAEERIKRFIRTWRWLVFRGGGGWKKNTRWLQQMFRFDVALAKYCGVEKFLFSNGYEM